MELIKSIGLFVCGIAKRCYWLLPAITFLFVHFSNIVKKVFKMDYTPPKWLFWVLLIMGLFIAMSLTYHDLRMKKDALEQTLNKDRFNAIMQLKRVCDNIPPNISTQELIEKLKTDQKLYHRLPGRMVRIFGIRTEQFLYINPEIIEFIDTQFQPLYEIGMGRYDFKEDKIEEFATLIIKLKKMVNEEEKQLIKKIKTG